MRFISIPGARKRPAGSAIRAAHSCPLTRRLATVSQDVKSRAENCKTKDFVELPIQLPEGLNKSLLGRAVAHDVYKPLASGKPGKTLLAEKGALVTMPLLREVLEGFQEHPEHAQGVTLPVRSVLKCKSEFGVCQTCYGTFLATGGICEIGDAVGIIAAQSIG